MSRDAPSSQAELLADPRLAVFGRTGWLSEQPEAFRAKLLAIGRLQAYPAGHRFFGQSDVIDSFLGLAEGRWELAQRIGGRDVRFHLANPGFWAGDTSVVGARKVLHTLTGTVPCLVVSVPGPSLRAMLHDEPRWWPCMFAHRRKRLSQVVLSTALHLTRSPRALLAARLLNMTDAGGVAQVTKNDLSAIIGVARGTVQRALRELCEAGAVESGYGRIAVLDRPLLTAFAQGADPSPLVGPPRQGD